VGGRFVRPLVSSSIAPGNRAHAVPALEATAAVGWCGHARRARRGGAVVGEHAAAVERKASGRRGREGGVREPWRSRSRSPVVVMREYFF
jgi:hypothetical protein